VRTTGGFFHVEIRTAGSLPEGFMGGNTTWKGVRKPCGSERARESGLSGTFSLDVPMLSRAGSLPQGVTVF
jgi:hypothetical protein